MIRCAEHKISDLFNLFFIRGNLKIISDVGLLVIISRLSISDIIEYK